MGMERPLPETQYSFYLEENVYLSWLPKFYADCCFDLGETEEAIAAYKKIEQAPSLTEKARQEIWTNLSLLHLPNKITKTKNMPRRIEF
jgi:hypothetical protein